MNSNPNFGYERAVAAAPAGPTTQAVMKEAVVANGGPQHAATERAIGTAHVDKSFLAQFDNQNVDLTQAMERIRIAEQEKASNEQQAMAALQEAARLMAEANDRQRIAQEAAASAERELALAQERIRASAHNVQLQKEAEAGKARCAAEVEARMAARKKAEEEASLQAARLAALEKAEAEAALKVAEDKMRQATIAQATLLSQAKDAKMDSVAATQRAADATAAAEAREREAQLAALKAAEVSEHLQQASDSLPSLKPTGPTTAVLLTQTAPIVSSTTSSHTSCECWGSNFDGSKANFLQTRAVRQPRDEEIKYLLHVSIRDADLSSVTGLGHNVKVRMVLGDVEAISQTLPCSGSGSVLAPWNIEASLPVVKPTDMLVLELFEGSFDFTGFGTAAYNPGQSSGFLGRVFVKIDNLVDGHISRENPLRMDGRGGIVHTWLHMEPWASRATLSSATSTSTRPYKHGNVQRYDWHQEQSTGGMEARGVTGDAGVWYLKRFF